MGKRAIAEIVNDLLLTKSAFSSGELGREAHLSRQALHRHLRALVAAGRLRTEGKGRGARYLAPASTFHRRFRRKGLVEDEVWTEVRKAIPELDRPENVRARAVLAYAFTEMLNNAIDHSGSTGVEVSFDLSRGQARFAVIDHGVGVYENVRARLGLPTTLAALQELSKGKVTTQPQAHTGQGIFFTSKMGDVFELEANGLHWVVDNRRDDVAVADVPVRPGTTVRFELALATAVEPAEIFGRYSRGDDFEFDTSRVVVRLFERGVDFVSRSEAKRVVAGLDRFRHVVLDFQGVKSVGQGFADEIFRVWAGAHPEVTVEPVNMRPAVERMVARGRAPGRVPRLADAAAADATPAAARAAPAGLPAGWSMASARKVLDDADAVTELPDLHDPRGKISIATRRNVRRADWAFLGIVVARSDGGAARTILNAFALPRQEASEILWASPTEALRRFVSSYGRELTVGQSTSAAGGALVTIGYAIDHARTREDLTRAGVHIEFS